MKSTTTSLIVLAFAAVASVVRGQSPAVVPPSCTNVPDALETRDIPTLINDASGFKQANVFTLRIESKMMNNRTDATIVLQAGSDRCNYPTATSLWTKSYDGCTEVWTAAIPWTVLSTECGLTRTINADTTVFDGEVAVTQYEVIGDVRGTPVTRELDTGMLYQITFPTAIALTSAVSTIFAPVGVLAAITFQDYNRTRGLGEVDLFTSVQYPFTLVDSNGASTVQIVLPDNSTIVPTIRTSDTNGCPANQACERTYRFDLAPNGVCRLDGTYRLSFQLACSASFSGECPLQPSGGNSGYVEFVLTGEDLCGVFRENVDLSGVLASYLSAAYLTPRSAFVVGQNTYWKASVSSSKVSIVQATLTRVATSYDSQADVVLYQVPSVTAIGSAVQYVYDGNGGVVTDNRFRFNASTSVFPVPADQSKTAVVKCNVAVQYFNTAARKRVVRYVNDLPFVHDQEEKRQLASAKLQDVSAAGEVELVAAPAATITTIATVPPPSSDTNSNKQPTPIASPPPTAVSAGGVPGVEREQADPPATDKGSVAGGGAVTISLIAVGIALLVCCVGIAGLTAFFVAKRQRQQHADLSAA